MPASNSVDVCIGNAAVTQHRVAALLLLMVLVRYVLRRLRDIRQRQCRPFTTRFCNSILYEYPDRASFVHDVTARRRGHAHGDMFANRVHFRETRAGYRAASEINSNYESIDAALMIRLK